MDEEGKVGFRPPYGAFQTFYAFLNEVVSKPLPPQIDRSLLQSKSGTDQALIFSALKGFGFIGDDLAVLPLLTAWQDATEEQRAERLGSLVRHFYPEQMQVSEKNGTEQQLLQSFETAFGYTGETRRKAMTFFLHTARTAGLSLSAYFPKTRSGSGSSATRRKSSPRKKNDAPSTPIVDTTTPVGDTYKVTLKAGGSVTLTVSVSHFALSRNRADRDFVNGLIDALTDYGDVETTEAIETNGDDAGED